jgi:hypothetical protein
MMSESGELARIGRSKELLEVIGRFGDRGCDFIWRNKGALATASALDGAPDLADIAAEHVARPVAEAGGKLAIEAARNVNRTLVGAAGLAVVALPGVCRRMFRTCRREAIAGETPTAGPAI